MAELSVRADKLAPEGTEIDIKFEYFYDDIYRGETITLKVSNSFG